MAIEINKDHGGTITTRQATPEEEKIVRHVMDELRKRRQNGGLAHEDGEKIELKGDASV
jgi:hypothetical protein